MKRALCLVPLLAWVALGPARAAHEGDGKDDPRRVAPLSSAEFEKLHRELVPSHLEAWQTIPWRLDLLTACADARKSGKPLFMWVMNGHPLGCT